MLKSKVSVGNSGCTFLRRSVGVITVAIWVSLTQGCSANATQPNGVGSVAKPQQLETIYGFTPRRDSIKLLVKSHGCTQKEDFTLHIDEYETSSYVITVEREKPDRCRALPRLFPVELTLSQSLPENVTIQLSNPFGLQSSLPGKREKR